MSATRQTLAYALLALGALWLLIEIGFVPPSLTLALLEWWPILIVGLGLDLVLPSSKRGPLPVTAYAGVVIILIALFGLSGRSATPTTFAQAVPGGARTLAAEIELGSVATTIGAAGPGQAVEASFEGVQPGKVELSGATNLEFELSRGRSAMFDFRRNSWNIDLTPNLPLELELRTGSGAVNVDLAQHDLSQLSLDSGSGGVTLNLPGGGLYYSADIDGGSGSMTIGVQPGASLDLALQTHSGATRVTIAERTDLQLTLRTRSGSVDIDLPDDAPIHLEVQDDGSGRLRVPDFLTRRSGSGDTGVWQSSTFERGGRVIHITVVQAGSGSITFR